MAMVILTQFEERGDFVITSPSGEYDLQDLVMIYYRTDPNKIEYQFQAGYIVYGSEFFTQIHAEESGSEAPPTWRMILNTELNSDPLGIGYAHMAIPDICAALNNPNRKRTERFVTLRTLFSEIGPLLTASIYGKMLAASQQNVVLAMGLDMLKTYSQGGGINICDDVVIGLIRQLGDQLLTREEADALESLAYVSRAVELIGREVTVEDIESLHL